MARCCCCGRNSKFCRMRVQSCAGKCSKVILLLVNIVIFLAGGGMLGLGIYYHLEGGLYEQVLNELNGVITVPVVMMFLGSLFICISFFAIVGALCEVVIMLKIYLSIIAIVLILEVILMAVCVAMRGEAEKKAVLAIHNLMEHYGNDEADELNIITKTIDQTQIWLDCCGLDGPEDWKNKTKAEWWATKYNNNTDVLTLPGSCCIDSTSTSCQFDSTETQNTHHTAGCRKEFYKFVEENVTYITVAGIVMIVLQVFIMISALKIRYELSSKYECDDYASGSNMEITSL